MRTLKLVIPAAALMAGFLVCSTASYGKPDYAKKENLKSCTTCHSKMGAKPELNDYGKCYQQNNHSLTNCKLPDKK